MAGSILGKDQVAKINAVYPRLLAHIKELLEADRSAFGLMKVHVQVENLDSDQLFKIFKDLSFISPAEKKALVRAAVYQTLVTSQESLIAEPVPEILGNVEKAAAEPQAPLATFTPPPFKLNVATAASLKTEEV